MLEICGLFTGHVVAILSVGLMLGQVKERRVLLD